VAHQNINGSGFLSRSTRLTDGQTESNSALCNNSHVVKKKELDALRWPIG